MFKTFLIAFGLCSILGTFAKAEEANFGPEKIIIHTSEAASYKQENSSTTSKPSNYVTKVAANQERKEMYDGFEGLYFNVGYYAGADIKNSSFAERDDFKKGYPSLAIGFSYRGKKVNFDVSILAQEDRTGPKRTVFAPIGETKWYKREQKHTLTIQGIGVDFPIYRTNNHILEWVFLPGVAWYYSETTAEGKEYETALSPSKNFTRELDDKVAVGLRLGGGISFRMNKFGEIRAEARYIQMIGNGFPTVGVFEIGVKMSFNLFMMIFPESYE